MHSNAAGAGIKLHSVDKLYEYANKKLADVNFNEGVYEADFVLNGNTSYLAELIKDLNKGKSLYGQGCPEPVLVVENIALPPNGYSIIGKNRDTLRFEFNKITYVKFKASELIEQLEKTKGGLNITVIGRGNINTWGGYNKPQILIDDIEVEETSLYTF